MNLSLKFAILSTGRTQRRASVEAGIPEGRITAAIHGRGALSDTERHRLAKVLGVSEDALASGRQ